MGIRVAVTGGTGSVGARIVERLLAGGIGDVERVVAVSRDESRQWEMRQRIEDPKLVLVVGDVRNERSLRQAFEHCDVVIHAAALKHVPICEGQPVEAVENNILGTANVISAAAACGVRSLVLIGTDKAVNAGSVMGMTKAIAERLIVEANVRYPGMRSTVARFGNVLGSHGSLVPLVRAQVAKGGPVTLTSREMTRFMFPLDAAVSCVFAALESALPGEIVVPVIPTMRVADVVEALVDGRCPIVEVGSRPGEKMHEELVSREEAPRARRVGSYIFVSPMLHMTKMRCGGETLLAPYSSADQVMSAEEARAFIGA